MSSPLRLGTRGSALAQWQAEWVAARLTALGVEVALAPISTRGDRQSGPIERLGAPGVFTKEIQQALLDRRIDLAVHSLKDLATEPVGGLCLAAVPERETPGDVLVAREADSLDALPQRARVGTGSLRRRAQLAHVRPDLAIEDIRGNVDTRLKKLDLGQYDAIVLAEAGLRRLGLSDRITQRLPEEIMLPAVGQGALGLETRAADEATLAVVTRLDHAPSHAAVTAERAMLAALEGGCLAPIGALARVEGETLALRGRVLSADGVEKVETALTGPIAEAELLGHQVAEALLQQGAAELIRAARDGTSGRRG